MNTSLNDTRAHPFGRMSREMQKLVRLQVGRPLLILFTVFALGTIGFKIQNWNEWSWLNCSYMAVMTLTTVGYGDMLGMEHKPFAKLFAMVLMVVGVSVVVYAVSTVTAFIVEGELKAYFSENKMLTQISKLKNHYILCGAGATGHYVADEFCKVGQPFVVIDNSSEHITELLERYPDILYVLGDATEEEVLENANIKGAKFLVAMLGSDKDNLFLVVTARALNPQLKIAARAIDNSVRKKLANVGTDIIVSPNAIGGLRLASEILRPNVVSFLDKMLRDQSGVTRFGEAVVGPGSAIIGRTLADSQIRERIGLQVVAIKLPQADSFLYNPAATTQVLLGSALIVIGTVEQLDQLRQMTAHPV